MNTKKFPRLSLEPMAVKASRNTDKLVFNASISIHVVIQLILLILFGICYSYMKKLDDMKEVCPCAEHPYRKFIMYYPVFAIIYLLLTLFNPVLVKKNPSLGPLLAIASMIYTLFTFVFLIMAIRYVNALTKSHCKCSEDVRREVLYYWSIIHVTIIAIGLLIVILSAIFGAIFMSQVPSMKHVANAKNVVSQGVRNPVKNLTNISRRIKRLGSKK